MRPLLLVAVLPVLASMASLAQEKPKDSRETARKAEQPRITRPAPERKSDDDAARRAKEDAERRRLQAQQQRDAEERNRQRNAEERVRQRAAQQPERSAGQAPQRPKQQTQSQQDRWEQDRVRRHQDRLRDEDDRRTATIKRNPKPVAATTPAPAVGARVTCSAQPACPAATGSGNVCRGVQESYADTAIGMPEITARCRQANIPDPCGIDVAGDMSAVRSFRGGFGGGCAQQCANVARCQSAAR